MTVNTTLDSSGTSPARDSGAGMASTMATPDACGRTWLTPGQSVRVRLPWSEVCCHMRVADAVMTVQLTTGTYPMAQLISDDGHPFSVPIGTGEAGIFGSVREGFYAYTEGT